MPIRWGLLGCGDIARKRVAQAITDDPNSRLLAACRRDPARLREFCQAFGVERAYTSEADLLTDPDNDVVYIATPVRLHLPQTLPAAAAGKHVLVEKPMALSVSQREKGQDSLLEEWGKKKSCHGTPFSGPESCRIQSRRIGPPHSHRAPRSGQTAVR